MEPSWKTVLRYIKNNFLAGSTYQQYHHSFLSLQTIPLPHTKLMADLEKLCEKKGGFLTCGELFQEELYGANGYYATKAKNVLTNTPPRWAEPIFLLCKEYGYHFFGELGPGSGELAVRTLKLAEKENYDLSWGGVEIATELQKAIKRNFTKYTSEKKLKFLVEDIRDAQIKTPSLFVFPYSLDSVSPEVFINASDKQTYPTHMIGVTIKNGVLEEVVLTHEQLESRGISLKNGIYTDSEISLDLTSWRLSPMQRMYIAPHMFAILQDTVMQLPEGSRLLIIDEFRVDKGGYRSPHLFAPRNLMRVDRDCIDLLEGYRHIGEVDYYFPLPGLSSFIPALQSLGIDIAFSGSEYYTAAYIQKEKKLPEYVADGAALSQCLLTNPLIHRSNNKVINLPYDEKLAKSWLKH